MAIAQEQIGAEYTVDGGWGSHQPALRAIAKFIKIRSVIEFGGGIYSTKLFLDTEVFKDLASLITFEHNKEWGEHIVTADPRHKVIVIDAREFIDKSKNMKADFVFVDSAEGDRLELLYHGLTIAQVAAVHDHQQDSCEWRARYIRGFNSKIQTVFVSNEIDMSGMSL